MHVELQLRDSRNAIELALGGASKHIDDARIEFTRLAALIDDRSDVDGLRGALELVAYAIQGIAIASGHIAQDGTRGRPHPRTNR